MKTVVLLFHPNLANSVANRALKEVAEQAGIEVRDMYALYPDFKIDVAAEQAVLAQADRIVFQFPMYWYSTPALFKQWEDDVFAYGWAYGSTGKALLGKELQIAVTTGAPASSYTETGDYGVTVETLLLPHKTSAKFVGMTYLQPFVINGVMSKTKEQIHTEAQNYVRVLK